MKVKIRKATLKDAQKILKLLNESNNLRGNDREYYELQDVKDYINNKLNKIFVYELDKKIVGVFISQFWKTYVYLYLIAVDSRYQGKGIGKDLFNFLENLTRKYQRELIEVDTEINNKKMKSLLEGRQYKRGKEFLFYSKSIK